MDTYEKKYKEAQKWIESIYSELSHEQQMEAEAFFPELKESEDERISKEIIKYLERTVPHHHRDEVLKSKEWTVWLEKQGEQNSYTGVSFKYNGHTFGMYARDGGAEILMDGNLKAFVSLDKSFVYPVTPIPVFKAENFYVSKVDGQIHDMTYNHVNNVEPKFKVGDWVTNSIETVQITGYDIDYGYQVDYKGNLQHRDTDIIEKKYHLWTIQDAKEGDVLDANGAPFIYKKHSKDYVYFYCGVNLAGDFIEANGIDTWDSNNKVYPATKEQRDLLFQNMKEAGYEWDADKKELKLLITNGGDFVPTWSEEDEVMIKVFDSIIRYIVEVVDKGALERFGTNREELFSWLKSLRPQSHWKPTKQQLTELRCVISGCSFETSILVELEENLKKLL